MTCEFGNNFYLIVNMSPITSQMETTDGASITLGAPKLWPLAKFFLALELNLLWQNLKQAIEYLFGLFLINSH